MGKISPKISYQYKANFILLFAMHVKLDALGGVNNYLNKRDSEPFFVLARRGEAQQSFYCNKPQRRQRGKGPEPRHER